ncbi:MAG: hypothetical protein ACM3L9_05595 [Deltaproteobacteria bacterium]
MSLHVLMAFALRLWSFVRAVLPTVLVFLVVGPVAGFVAIFLPISLTAIPGPVGALQGLLAIVAMMPVGIPIAYAMGYVPAVLTGATVAALDCVVDLRSYRVPVAIVLGGSITVLLLYRVIAADGMANDGQYSTALAVAGAVGAIAAGVSALLAPRRFPSPRLDAGSE